MLLFNRRLVALTMVKGWLDIIERSVEQVDNHFKQAAHASEDLLGAAGNAHYVAGLIAAGIKNIYPVRHKCVETMPFPVI